MARTYELGEARNSRGLLPLAVVSGLVAAVLVFIALVRAGDEGRPGSGPAGAMVRVVIAEQNIPARTEIGPEMLSVVEVPGDLAVDGAVDNVEALVGETTRYPVAAGQQVTVAGVGSLNKEAGLEAVVRKDMRALSVEVDEVRGVGGLLLPGDRVDVIAVLAAEAAGVDSAVTVLQNVEVLAVAQKTQEALPRAEAVDGAEPDPSASASSGQRPADAEPQPDANTVTLSITPEQAQLLALIQNRGQIWLSLRPFGDDATVTLTESTLFSVAEPVP